MTMPLHADVVSKLEARLDELELCKQSRSKQEYDYFDNYLDERIATLREEMGGKHVGTLSAEIDTEDVAEIVLSHFPNASRKVLEEMTNELLELANNKGGV